MQYQLMNKDAVVATCKEQEGIGGFTYAVLERNDSYLPYGFISVDD